MLLDASSADRSAFEGNFDVCVVGTGPAGMTVARRLAAAGLTVALLEGGGVTASNDSSDLYLGESVGHPYDPLQISRMRLFGGSSNHWGGKCRALDEVNFSGLPHNPMGVWPIAKSELDRYAAGADETLELPPATDAAGTAVTQTVDRFRSIRFRYSPPVRFGDKYHDEIAASPRIACAVNANLVDLRLDEPGQTGVAAAIFRSFAPGDPGFEVKARAYVLALGGLETPRMLLNFRSQKPNGVGNDYDTVGRYFCEHPHYRLGGVLLRRPMTEAEAAPEEGKIFTPTPAFLERHEVLTFSTQVYPAVQDELSLPNELVRSAACVNAYGHDVAQRLLDGEIDCDRGGLRNYFAQPGGPVAVFANVVIRSEQTPLRDSRVGLGDERDALGFQRISLDWRLSEMDVRTVRVAAFELAAHLAEQDLGRMKIMDYLLEEQVELPGPGQQHRVGGHHHMCSMRMSLDPNQGAVDPNCRVHSVSNLYIAGSSVFSSPGYANPTYTIVQLSLRLGDHLATRLGA